MSAPACFYAFTIPLARDNALELEEAIRFVQEHGNFDRLPDDPLAYESAFPDAPPGNSNSRRSRIALAIANAMWAHGECEGDFKLEELAFSLHEPRKGFEWSDQNGLHVETRQGAWGSVNLATALITTSQAELGALPMWFSFHTHDGWSDAGAVFIGSGEEPVSIDLEEWGMEQEHEYQKRRKAAAEPSGETHRMLTYEDTVDHFIKAMQWTQDQHRFDLSDKKQRHRLINETASEAIQDTPLFRRLMETAEQWDRRNRARAAPDASADPAP